MRAAEKNLLLAVRNAIRAAGPFANDECEIEYDELAPATSGDKYIIVMPAGWRPGARHNTCGGISDLLYQVDVLVARRITHVPRDRRRERFLDNLQSLTTVMDKVFEAVDFNYTTMNAANTLITAETASTEGFTEPLKFVGMDGRPRIVGAELFGGSEENAAGLARTIHFGNARRITHK